VLLSVLKVLFCLLNVSVLSVRYAGKLMFLVESFLHFDLLFFSVVTMKAGKTARL